MFLSSKQEILTLLGTVAGGVAIGVTVDFFRILRRSFPSAARLVWLQDILMWICVFTEACVTLYIVSSGEVRWYSLLGFMIGFVLYSLTVSRYVVATATAIILSIRRGVRAVLAIVATPLKRMGRFTLTIWRKLTEFSKKFHILFNKNSLQEK